MKAHFQLPFPLTRRLPRGFPPLPVTAVLRRIASLLTVPFSLGLIVSPIVVLRDPGCLLTGAVRGLRMLVFQSFSFSLLTIRRACEAVNIVFSFGGLPDDALVGLRRRC